MKWNTKLPLRIFLALLPLVTPQSNAISPLTIATLTCAQVWASQLSLTQDHSLVSKRTWLVIPPILRSHQRTGLWSALTPMMVNIFNALSSHHMERLLVLVLRSLMMMKLACLQTMEINTFGSQKILELHVLDKLIAHSLFRPMDSLVLMEPYMTWQEILILDTALMETIKNSKCSHTVDHLMLLSMKRSLVLLE